MTTLESEDEAALAHAGVARSLAPGEPLRLPEVGIVYVTAGTLDERTASGAIARHEGGALLNLERLFGRFGGAELVAVTPSAVRVIPLEEFRVLAREHPSIIVTQLGVALAAQRTQAVRMEQMERLASLGELMGMVAHDAIGPLNLVPDFLRVNVWHLKDLQLALLTLLPLPEQARRLVNTALQRLDVDNLEPFTVFTAEERVQLCDAAPELQVWMEALQESVAQITNVGDISQFARDVLGSVLILSKPGERGVVSVRDTILRAVRLHQKRARALRIDLHVDVDSDALVDAEPGGLLRIWSNLVANALDAGRPDGHVRLTLGGTEQLVEVTVADGGAGVPPDLLPRIFDPFVTTKHHGTGLGLHNVQRLVDEYGGTISVSSGQSETIFVVRFPRAVASDVASDEDE